MKIQTNNLATRNSPGRNDRDRRANPCNQAFMAIDALFGMIIIGAVTVLFLGTLRYERGAEIALANSRSALHLAEHALLNLQHGQPLPMVAADVQLTIHPATGGTAPAGFSWVKVDATIQGHARSLLGVVPTSSLAIKGKNS